MNWRGQFTPEALHQLQSPKMRIAIARSDEGGPIR